MYIFSSSMIYFIYALNIIYTYIYIYIYFLYLYIHIYWCIVM